jgi:pimeloyl-ACP methyl ester carboxylesterase
VNPGGKLPVTFPHNVGQIPIYCNHEPTGRPCDTTSTYNSRYRDLTTCDPLYPLGFGLSYTTFDISNLRLSSASMPASGSVKASVDVRNTRVDGGRRLAIHGDVEKAVGGSDCCMTRATIPRNGATVSTTKTNTLDVPGANLYYEVRGAGPVLLLICGGVYDAAGYAGLAGQLADRYTVVTYDRRGNSRSPLDGPAERQSIEVHGDDAHRVLNAVGVAGEERAYVFGNSSGAQIGLELAARHPEQVRTLVAHEPPSLDLLPDADRFRALIAEVEAALAKDGPGAALGIFGAGMQMRGGEPEGGGAERIPGGAEAPQGEPDTEPDKETAAMMARMGKNMEFFISYEVPPFGRWVPDVAALRSSPVRVVAAAGEASAGEPPHRVALALAEQLGGQAAFFPGDHGGFGLQTAEFAAKLDEVLSTSAT